ncbi:MAG TPA: glycosyltransferase [Ignavibacteriaceae bacterium]|nr:glycosyltransferase [Ignavibacteriaceae bacterium]
MKITILSTAYPLRGGISHFVGLLYKELSKEYTVNVITFKRQYPSILFPGKSQIESGEPGEKILSEIIVDSINPFNWFKVGKKIRDDEPDLLIYKFWMPFFAPCFGTISKIAKKNKKTKVLTICDNVIPHEKRPGDISITKYFFKYVDYFVLLSKKVQEDLLKLVPGAKNKILPHPVYSNFGESINKNEARKFLKLPQNEKLILFFGFIRDYKGLDILLEALNLIKDKSIKLIVAGEFYSNEEKYKRIIYDNKLDDRLYLFTDFIPTSEVKYYFSASDAVILPYRDATQSGIVQIAMNFSKPVIATNVGGLAEVIKEDKTGYIVERENPEALAKAIEKFYSENKEAEFVNNTKEEINKYSWDNFTHGILKLINS